MGVPDRLPGASPFCNEMIAPHLLRTGGAHDMMIDYLEKERNRNYGAGKEVRC